MFVFPPNLHIDALTLSVAVFGGGASKKVIKGKQGHKSGAPTL